MSQQLKLVLRADLGSDVSTFDLLSPVGDSSWRQQIASSEDEAAFIDEAMMLHFSGSSDDDLAATLQSLDQYLRDARRFYVNPIEASGVWLRAQLAGESGARQALIVDAKRGEVDVLGWYIDRHIMNDYPLGLKRTPFWEDTTADIRDIAAIDSVGGYEQLLDGGTNEVLGDVPARIALLMLTPPVGSESDTPCKFWMGFRTDRFGLSQNFVPRWEAELGVAGAGADTDITNANDSTASGTGTGRSIRCTFNGTSTLAQRWLMEVSDAAPTHPEDQAGDFLVIARLKCTDATTQARVRLRSGFVTSSQWRTSPRVLVSGTAAGAWNLYELGQVTFPSTGRGWEFLTLIAHQALALDAERIAGSGGLDIDCVILVPVSEGHIFIDGGSHVIVKRSGGLKAYMRRMPDLRLSAAGTNYSENEFYSDLYASQSGGVPVGSKVYMVMCSARDDSSKLSDQTDVSLRTYSRWLTLRGAE